MSRTECTLYSGMVTTVISAGEPAEVFPELLILRLDDHPDLEVRAMSLIGRLTPGTSIRALAIPPSELYVIFRDGPMGGFDIDKG